MKDRRDRHFPSKQSLGLIVSCGLLTLRVLLLFAMNPLALEAQEDFAFDPRLYENGESEEALFIPDNVREETPDARRVYFVVLSKLEEPLFYMDEGKAYGVPWSLRMFPSPVFQSRSDSVTLARSYTNEAGETAYAPVASVAVPQSVRDAIIVIQPLKHANRPDAYTLHYFNHGMRAHPLNTARFINLSNREILVRLNDSRLAVAPYDEKQQRIGQDQTHLTMHAGVLIEQEGQILSSLRQQYRRNSRVLLLGFPDHRPQQGSVFTVVVHRDLGIQD